MITRQEEGVADWCNASGFAAAVQRDDDVIQGRFGKSAWSWAFVFPDHNGNPKVVSSSDVDRIFSFGDSAGVLHCLAVFLDAWAESFRYPSSDNRDLFPLALEPFLAVHEEFYLDTMSEEDRDG